MPMVGHFEGLAGSPTHRDLRVTVQGHLDAWFGTPGIGSQTASHLVGDFTAKPSPV